MKISIEGEFIEEMIDLYATQYIYIINTFFRYQTILITFLQAEL